MSLTYIIFPFLPGCKKAKGIFEIFFIVSVTVSIAKECPLWEGQLFLGREKAKMYARVQERAHFVIAK